MPADDTNKTLLAHFSDPNAAARYAEGPVRFVPGFVDLHRMTTILLAERAAKDARVLVLGAGGGLELKAMATAQSGWSFVGVDPAAAMLDVAKQTMGPMAERVAFCDGYIDDAPEGPFDAATCLLTLHFLAAEERRRTVREIWRRLRPRAPFVAAHSCIPPGAAERPVWLSRYAAFAVASGVDPAMAEGARASIDAALNIFTPEEDEAILREAGFHDVTPFYTAFTWRGWVAYA
jgi:tRNA (cmo5U34)-methyltransferase